MNEDRPCPAPDANAEPSERPSSLNAQELSASLAHSRATLTALLLPILQAQLKTNEELVKVATSVHNLAEAIQMLVYSSVTTESEAEEDPFPTVGLDGLPIRRS